MSPERYQRLQQCLRKRQLDLTVVMENVHKSHNFAAIVRSCDAVGVHTVHAVTDTGDIGYHHQTSAGANKWVRVASTDNIQRPLRELRQQGFQLLAAHVRTESIDFREVDYTQPTAIIMGSELYGISEYTESEVDQCIMIPMQGMVESFNVSVATALILYEAQRQREQSGHYLKAQLQGQAYADTLFEWCYPDIAEQYQKQGKPYPKLDEDGYLLPISHC